MTLVCLLQARDEVITVLKADKIDLALLEAKYGFVTPPKVLKGASERRHPGQERQLGGGHLREAHERGTREADRVHNSTYMSESSDTAAQILLHCKWKLYRLIFT